MGGGWVLSQWRLLWMGTAVLAVGFLGGRGDEGESTAGASAGDRFAADGAPPADGGQRPDELEPRVRQLLADHCLDCHSGTEPAAGLGLDHFQTLRSIRRENDVWEKVWRRVEDGSMPPAEHGEMPAEERRWLGRWVDDALHKIDCSQGISPGQVTIRRLTRTEYRNSIRDLLGIDYLPAAAFPGDDSGYGFDNIGDVLSLPPVLMEKYLDAAETIARQTIQTPEDYQPPSRVLELDAVKLEGGINRNAGLVFYSNGTAAGETTIEVPGNYQVVFEVSGQQAGNEPCRMSVQMNKAKPRTFEIKEHEVRQSITQAVRWKAGKQPWSVSFDNDFYNEQGPEGNKDRNLLLHRVRVVGPLEFGSQVSAAHRQFFFLYPAKREQETEAAQRLLSVWASRFYRRPASTGEVDALVRIYQEVRRESGSFELGLQVALQAIMVSPKFLYKVERPAPEDGSVRPLTNYELATNLSYFLWGTTPDPALLETATQRDLQDPAILRTETRRLLASPKSEALVHGFFSQWLQLRALENFSPDPDRFPGVDRLLLADMQRETQLFCWEIVRQDRSVLDLLSAEFTFVNARLARHYGDLGGVATNDQEFVRVPVPRDQRGGLLTHASILAVTSNPTRTSPVRRGRWIMENLLGTPPPPAAPDVMPLESQELVGTLRQRMEQHRTDPNCAACHQMMDPLGFALENFDAVGRWRDTDNGHPVDARGELPSGEVFTGVRQLREVLLEQKREAFLRCLTQKMLIYALGRGLRYEDQCAVNAIVKRVQERDHRISELILGIVESVPFRQRQKALEE
jgi:mono/diheme cytochrome c family protein